MNKELRTLFFLIFVVLFFGGTIHNSLFIIQKVDAATNISSNQPEHWAWNDTIGWIDFYSTTNIRVTPSSTIGYASSSIGYIAFDCVNSPNGNVCGNPATWQVSNDGAGNLSGWAWSDSIGWISFDCHNPGGDCVSSNYQVTIDSSGIFSGWAWNDIIGWISFNCYNSGIGDTCYVSNYKVKTSWVASTLSGTLLSSTFDTGVPAGVAFNSIMWKGSQPCDRGTCSHVEFQFASANQKYGVGGIGSIDIDPVHRNAWNDSIGWWDFGYYGNVNVTSTQLTGYAYNTNLYPYEISLDCATSPAGNICISQSDYKVNRDPSSGELSGWAWNDVIGWISFSSENNPTNISCNPSDGFGAGEYCVTVDPTDGVFSGWAWNDLVGWISFNCNDFGVCGTSKEHEYYVATDQSGFPPPKGPSCTSLITDTYPTTGPDAPVALNRLCHNNQRYYRYQIILYSNFAQTVTPRVDEVIVNWSP